MVAGSAAHEGLEASLPLTRYANGWNRRNCFLFINQPLAKGSTGAARKMPSGLKCSASESAPSHTGKQWKDAMCYIKKESDFCCCMHALRSGTSMASAGATVHCFPKVENDMAGKTCILCCSQDHYQ